MNKQEAMETILGCKAYVMGNGVLTEFIPFEIAEDIIEKLNTPEVQKVVIPRYVSDWIGYCKANGLTLLGAIEPISKFGEGLANTFTGNLNMCLSWVEFNQDTFARAWLEGYEVEEEQLYTVELPDPNRKGTNRIYLCKADNTGKVYICKGNFNPKKNKNLWLTEEEIKKDFDWAWQFAVPVEEK